MVNLRFHESEHYSAEGNTITGKTLQARQTIAFVFDNQIWPFISMFARHTEKFDKAIITDETVLHGAADTLDAYGPKIK